VKRAVIVIVALAGCDKLFDLDPVELDGDSSVADRDASNGDSKPIDAKPCVPVNHDEDLDGIDDACDLCPTVTDDKLDTDGDGVGNDCDPNLGTNGVDKILLSVMFKDAADFSSTFIVTDGTPTWEATGNGRVTLFSNNTITTMGNFIPTRLEVRTAQVGQGVGATASVIAAGATCTVTGGNCASNNTLATCIRAFPGGAQGELGEPSQNVRSIDLDGPSPVECSITGTSPSNRASAGSTAPFGNSDVQLTTNATGALIVESIVIYGSG